MKQKIELIVDDVLVYPTDGTTPPAPPPPVIVPPPGTRYIEAHEAL